MKTNASKVKEDSRALTKTDDRDEKPTIWLRPEYRIKSLKNGDYQLVVELPGVSKKEVEVSLEKDVLTIIGRRPTLHDKGWKPLFQEIPRGDFRLAMTLNLKVDGERISAHVENGVLTLNLPIVEAAKPREIAIE
ncbi:MAG: Hsp20/alpha crystallin family protein [Akkermansiaceae bacterium]|jgi:HSP20 family protein